MKTFKTALTIICCAVQILFAAFTSHAQSAIFSQAFTGGATATTQCTAFNAFSAALNPGIYLSVKISGTYDATGIICQDPVIANAVANALKTSTSYTSPVCNGNVWSVCNRGSYMELWLNPGTQCNGSNCPNPGYIIRPCISNGNWGGVNSITCNTTISQTMTLEFFFGIPCTGVPTANVTAPVEVCPKKPFEVKLSVPYTGTTFQWEYSTNNSTWTPYTGTVNQVGTFTDQITVPTWYRCKLTCLATSQTYTTAPYLVNIAPFYYCYCDGSKATGGTIDVGNVKVNTLKDNTLLLNNGTATPTTSNTTATNAYTDLRLSVPPVPMYHDSSYLLTVSQITSAAAFAVGTAAVYIDYNRNGTFDTWERALLETTNAFPANLGVVRDTFTMPDTAGYGLTGMRVIIRSGTTAPDTCASYTDGETEDYLIDIRRVPCSGPPNAGTIKGDTSMCVGYDYLLTDSTYEKSTHGIVRSWFVSADNVFWTPIPGSAGKDTLMRLFDNGQPLYYKMQAICTHTDDTSYAPTHKVNLKPTYKCYCHSQAIGGLANDTSDVGGFGIYNFATNDGGAHLGNPRAFQKRQDHTDLQPIEMWVDSVYNFHVFHTMPKDQHSDAKITVFVDFNNNHKYDIPEERIYTGFTSVGTHTLLGQVVIPNAAIVDVPTGLRVIVNNNVGPNPQSDEACGTYLSGETEDYMVIFRRPFNVRVDEVNGLSNVRIYPNPATEKVTVLFNAANVSDNVEVKLLSVTGQLVKSYSYQHEGGRFVQQIDLSGQAKGVYFMEINAGGLKSTQKLILQ